MGLREYNKRYFSGIILLLNPTGEIYSPNWTINGTIYLKSRYLTFNEVINRPNPKAVRKVTIRNPNTNINFQVGKKEK